MVLNRDSKLVKFSYLLYKNKYRYHPDAPYDAYYGAKWWHTNIPATTSLCAFFWRTFVFMPLLTAGSVAIAAGIIGGVGLFIYRYPFDFLAISGIVLTTLVIVFGAAHATRTKTAKRIASKAKKRMLDPIIYASTWRVLVEGVKAIKGKVCPIIELK